MVLRRRRRNDSRNDGYHDAWERYYTDTAPGVTQGPQNGPSGVNTTAYWDTILGTKGTNGKVESVSFANVMGNPSLQALVTVRHSDANSTLGCVCFQQHHQ